MQHPAIQNPLPPSPVLPTIPLVEMDKVFEIEIGSDGKVRPMVNSLVRGYSKLIILNCTWQPSFSIQRLLDDPLEGPSGLDDQEIKSIVVADNFCLTHFLLLH